MLVHAKEGDILGATVIGPQGGAFLVSLDTTEQAVLPLNCVCQTPGKDRLLAPGMRIRVRVVGVYQGSDFRARITVKELPKRRPQRQRRRNTQSRVTNMPGPRAWHNF